MMLTIDERIRDDGTLECVTIDVQDGELLVHVGSEAAARLPVDALAQVMARYGKPLAPDITLDGPTLEAGGGHALHRVRHLARYDVIARDFLVWTAPDQEPIAELAVTVAAALVHLAKLARAAASSAGP